MYNPADVQKNVDYFNSPEYLSQFNRKHTATAYKGNYNHSYLKGLNGLSKKDREEWEKTYKDELEGKTPEYKDNFFRNEVFKNLYDYTDLSEEERERINPEDKELYDNRQNLTIAERDKAVLKKMALGQADNKDIKSGGEKFLDVIKSPFSLESPSNIYNRPSAREQAVEYFTNQGEPVREQLKEAIRSMTPRQYEDAVDDFKDMSREISNYYKMFEDDYKLRLSPGEQQALMIDFMANERVAGIEYAADKLNRDYQRIVANNQTGWEKAVNAFEGGTETIVGSTAVLAGVAGGLAAGLVTVGKEDDESYWENVYDNIVNNPVTIWGSDLSTYGAWAKKNQEYYRSLGISENAIIDTPEQESAMLSWNTPWQLLQQYGFTAAIPLQSAGLSALNSLTARGIGTMAKGIARAGIGNVQNALRIAANYKKYANAIVPGIIGTSEGAMNALETQRQAYEHNKQLAEEVLLNKAIGDLDEFIFNNPEGAAQVARFLAPNNSDLISPEQETITESDLGEETKVGYSDRQLNLMKDILMNSPEVMERFKSKYMEDYKVAAEKAEEYARIAGISDFLVNSAVNGLINTGFKSMFQAKPVRKSLAQLKGTEGRRGLNKQVTIEETSPGSFKASPKKVTRGQLVKQRAKASVGEALEEYIQTLSSEGGSAISDNLMEQYLYSKYDSSDDTKLFVEDFSEAITEGLKAAGDALLSQEAIKSAIYGGLSTIMGGITTRIPSFGKGSGNLFQRLSPIDVDGILVDILGRGQKDLQNKNNIVADRINAFFGDKEQQELLFDAIAAHNWSGIVNDALQKGDIAGAEKARAAQMYSTLSMLDQLRGTEYYNSVMKAIQARANFDVNNLNNEESNEFVEATRYIRETNPEMSLEEAVTQMKKESQDMLDSMNEIAEESEDIEKTFGMDLDQDAKATMIFDKIALRRFKKLSNEYESKFKSLKSSLSGSKESSLNSEAKSLVALYGGITNAEKALSDIDKKITELQDSIVKAKENKAEPSALKMQEGILETMKERRAELREKIDAFKKSGKSVTKVENGKEVSIINDDENVLTSSEIMELFPEDRALILDKKRKNIYTEKQRKEIDALTETGITQDKTGSSFLEDIETAGKLSLFSKQVSKELKDAVNDIESLLGYVTRAKTDFAISNMMHKVDILQDYQNKGDYNGYKEYYESVLKNGSTMEKQFLGQLTADHAFAERLSNAKVAQELAENYIFNEETGTAKELSEEKDIPVRNTIEGFLEYLNSKGINMFKHKEGSPQSLRGKKEWLLNQFTSEEFEQYIESLRDKNKAYEYASPKDIVERVKNILFKAIDNYANARLVKSPITITETPKEKNNPPAPIITENKEIPKVSEQNAILSDIDAMLETTDINDVLKEKSEEVKDEIQELLREYKRESASIQDFIEKIDAKINDPETKEEIRNILNNISKKLKSEDKSQVDKTPSDTPAGTLDLGKLSTTIESADMATHYRMGTAVYDYYKQYIEPYLLKHPLKNSEIVFIVDRRLERSIAEKMENYKDSEFLPIVAAIKMEGGPLSIDSENYQPIAIMPASSSRRDNSGGIRELRNAALQQLNTTDGDFVIETTGNTSYQVSGVRSFAKDNEYQQSNDLHSVIDNDKPDSISTEDAIKDFLKRVFLYRKKSDTEKEQSKDGLPAVEVDNIKGTALGYVAQSVSKASVENKVDEQHPIPPVYLFVKDIYQTQARDSSDTLEEAMKKGNLVHFNSRTELVDKVLQKILNEFNSSSSKDIESLLNDLTEALNSGLKYALNLDPQARYDIRISTDQEGNSQLNVSLIGGGQIQIPLLSLALNEDNTLATEIEESVSETFLKNLLFDENIKGASLIRWQVDFGDMIGAPNAVNPKQKTAALDNALNLVKDKLFEVKATSLTPAVNVTFTKTVKGPNKAPNTVTQNNPQGKKGHTNEVITNGSSHRGVVVNGQIIDPDTSAPMGEVSTPKVETNSKQKAIEIAVSKMVESASKEFSPEYKEAQSVTSVGRETIFDDSSTPSSSSSSTTSQSNTETEVSGTEVDAIVGTSIDMLIRDYFEHREERLEKMKDTYPNMSIEQIQSLISSLDAFCNKYPNLHFIANGVRVQGKVRVNQGDTIREVPVKGVLDVVAYDDDGNFNILEIKTTNSDIEHKEDYWTRQLNMYKQLLESNYGVRVKSLQVMPITAPHNTHTKGKKSHIFKQGNNLQLKTTETIGNDTFTVDYTLSGNPSLPRLIPIELTDVVQIEGSDLDVDVISEAAKEGVVIESDTKGIVVKEESIQDDDFNESVSDMDIFGEFEETSAELPTLDVSESAKENAWDLLDNNVKEALEAKYKEYVEKEGMTMQEFWDNKLSEKDREEALKCAK